MNEPAHLTVRAAVAADLPTVGEVDALARRHAYTGIMPAGYVDALTPQGQHDSWAARLTGEAGTHRMLVAERGGTVVGYCYVGPGDDPAIGDLYALFVHPDAHGTGVAGQLMAAGLSALEAMGHRRFLLWVHADNRRAVRFYEKSGWVTDGTSTIDRYGATHRRYLYPA